MEAAESELATLERAMGTTGRAIEGLAEAWTRQDLLSLRNPDQPLTDGVMRTTLEQIAGLARDMFDLEGGVQPPSSLRELPHAFTFRVALCGYLSFQSRFADGSTGALSAPKARNDLVDSMQCASALHFDDFFTNDKRAKGFYVYARWLMDEIFLRAK